MIAALFDLDGTLYTGHIWQDLARHHWDARRNRRWVVAYLARNMAPVPLYRLGLLGKEPFFQKWGETMGWLLRGWTPDEAGALFGRLIEEQIRPNLRPDVLERVRQHRAAGHTVALVSGTFAPFLDRIAQEIDVPHAIGTPLEVRDGHYTGRIVLPLCQGEGKPQRAQAYFEERGLQVDWAASFAYADRDLDIPLLNLVGQPVAVYPDEALLAHAQAQGWPTIGAPSSSGRPEP
jgi:putative phosphoserine phosphatase/1-acylglycerol-3-phosphate O-acyltransferase